MGKPDFDDSELDYGEYSEDSRQSARRKRTRFHKDPESLFHSEKRSGKRFHRHKTPKDDFWPDEEE